MTEYTYDTPALTYGAPPPFSKEAEEAVLGAVLIDGEAIQDLTFLDPEDFYIERYRWAFIAARALRRNGTPIDYLTMAEDLEARGQIAEFGGPAELMRLINQTPSSLNGPAYGRIVQEKAGRRRLLKIAADLADAAYNFKDPTSNAISNGIDRLSRAVVTHKGAKHISHFTSEVYDEVQAALANPRDLVGISTGLPMWDRVSGGIIPGTVTRIVGDPGVGKSLLVMQILINIAKASVPVALYELEMKGTQPVRRSLSATARVATQALRTGKISQEDLNQFVQAVDCLSQYPFYLADDSHMTAAEIRADLQRLQEYHGVEVAAIDYEALIDGPGATENERRSKISDEVHAIAKDLNIALISVGDMTKAGISGEATGQAASAGTAHEIHNADELIRLKKKGGNIVSATWDKKREENGAGDYIELVRLPGLPAFEAAAPPSQR